MEIILFLAYTGCVFQAGKAEGDGKSSGGAYMASAFVIAIVLAVLAMDTMR